MTSADGLIVTHSSTVTPDQIDHLGHMNVRYYAVNACAATESLFGDGTIYDVYTRHHREQLLGTELAVRSGILSIDEGSTRLYHELVGVRSGEVAATFVHRVRATPSTPSTKSTPSTVPLAEVEVPTHGQPRSIDLDVAMPTLTLDEARHLDLAMRAPRTIGIDDTDGADSVPPDLATMMFWRGESLDGHEEELVSSGPNGEQLGWATMETRLVIDRTPVIGTHVQSFSATVSIADKTTQSVMWLFDLDSGELLASLEAVSVLFDIGARRAASIPDHMRAEYARRFHPELARTHPN